MYLDRIIAVRNSKTVYRDDDLCLKVFGEEHAKADVFAEALNQARLEETGLHVPKILKVEEIEGKWAIISEYVPGKTLAQLMQENPKKKNWYLASMAEWQLSLHAHPCPILPRLYDNFSRAIDRAELPVETRLSLHERLNKLPEYRTLCHGDFEPSNIIFTEQGVPFFLDWSRAAVGNACADAARSYLLLWMMGEIDGAEKYLSLYCEKSGIEKLLVQQWTPLVAADQFTRCRSAERAFLRSWIEEGGPL